MLKKYFTEITVATGLLGFVYASLLLTCNSPKKTVFNEKELNNKVVVNSILSAREATLLGKIGLLEAWVKKNTLPTGKTPGQAYNDSMTLLSQLKAQHTGTIQKKYQLEHGNKDTLLNYWQEYYSLNRTLLAVALKDTVKNTSLPIQFVDTFEFIKKRATVSAAAKRLDISEKYFSAVDFFEKYPSFGFWFVLSVAQAALWFLLILLLIGGYIHLKEQLAPLGLVIDLSGLIIKTILAALCMAVFTFFLYYYLIDSHPVKDTYFMDGFNARMLGYSVPGYLMAGVCFGAFLFWSRQLDKLNTTVTEGANTNIAAPGNDSQKKKYDLLKMGFTRSFGASALVLSVFVFWLGLLVQSLNSMDAMLIYEKLSGRKFLPYDFVYLMGFVHTMLLLIFYIPAKLKFDSLKIVQDDKDATKAANAGNPVFKKFFSAFSESFISMVIATSPLLASLLQKLVEGFLK